MPENYPAITKKCYLCIKKKELFESMRNIVILNSLEFSYPLPVLMRVFSQSVDNQIRYFR